MSFLHRLPYHTSTVQSGRLVLPYVLSCPHYSSMRQRFNIDSTDSQSESEDVGDVTPRESWCSSPLTFLIAFLSFTSIIDLILSWCASAFCIFHSFTNTGSGDTDETMALLGGIRIVWIVIVYGSVATFVPKRELSGPGRKAKMYTQGGHSLMLTYFLGCGAISEFVRDRCCREVAGILSGRDRVKNALVHRGFGLCVPLLVCHCLEESAATTEVDRFFLLPALFSSSCHVGAAVLLLIVG